MTNQEVVIYLNTPLVSRELKGRCNNESISRLRGKILSQEPTGFLIQIKSVGNERGWQEGAPSAKRIFIPIHKIDFMEME